MFRIIYHLHCHTGRITQVTEVEEYFHCSELASFGQYDLISAFFSISSKLTSFLSHPTNLLIQKSSCSPQFELPLHSIFLYATPRKISVVLNSITFPSFISTSIVSQVILNNYEQPRICSFYPALSTYLILSYNYIFDSEAAVTAGVQRG